jgi:hypothetical protein
MTPDERELLKRHIRAVWYDSRATHDYIGYLLRLLVTGRVHR